MARHRSRKAQGLPVLLVRLVNAAAQSGVDADGVDIRGAVPALRELGVLAAWALPIHGVFAANNNDVCKVIERVANDHLGFQAARRSFRDKVKAVGTFEQQDAIETKHHEVLMASDQAYFYAGLAFGLTLADFS